MTGAYVAPELLAPRPAPRVVVPPEHRTRYWRLGVAAGHMQTTAHYFAESGDVEAAAIVSEAERRLRGLAAALRVPVPDAPQVEATRPSATIAPRSTTTER